MVVVSCCLGRTLVHDGQSRSADLWENLLHWGSAKRFWRRCVAVDLQARQFVEYDERGEMPRAHLCAQACLAEDVARFFPVREMASSGGLDNAFAVIPRLLLEEIFGSLGASQEHELDPCVVRGTPGEVFGLLAFRGELRDAHRMETACNAGALRTLLQCGSPFSGLPYCL